jgi:hypothetical protein
MTARCGRGQADSTRRIDNAILADTGIRQVRLWSDLGHANPPSELQAIALTYSQYVVEHLCQKHADLLNGQLDEVGHAICQLGQISLDFLPIEQKVSCAHFVDHPLLDDEETTRCRRPATLAKVIIEGWPLCDEHKIKFVALHR